jgi:hypothetical protein
VGIDQSLGSIRSEGIQPVNKNPRTVLEVRDDLHTEIRRLAILNDIKIHELTNAIIEEYLKDAERVKVLIKRLKLY